MAYDLEEQEKIAELKAWWETYGNLVTGLIVVAALALGGYQFARYYKAREAAEAGAVYEQLTKAQSSQALDQVKGLYGVLTTRYARTIYAEMGALAYAKSAAAAGDRPAAMEALSWARDHASDDEYKLIARLRLSVVQLDQGQKDLASQTLSGDVPAAFQAAFEDRRGDVMAASNRADEARKDYEAALSHLASDKSGLSDSYRNVLQLKLDALSSPLALGDSTAPSAAVGDGTKAAAQPSASATPATAPATSASPTQPAPAAASKGKQ